MIQPSSPQSPRSCTRTRAGDVDSRMRRRAVKSFLLVIATGVATTIREMCRLAFAHVDLDWERHVVTDSGLHRPAEVDMLRGDPSKARAQLGWEAMVSLPEMLGMMVEADLRRNRG